jgi:thioesterase domain-containing protein
VPLNAKAQAMLRATSINAYSVQGLRPIFLVCGVNIYTQLARSLRSDRAVFGVFDELESRLAAGTFRQVDIGKSDTHQLASAYLKAMKQVQPHGPYIIGGLSFGGVLAYEMAQQLKDQGEEVEWLMLLETILPRAIRAPNLLVKIRASISNLSARMTGYEPKEALGVMRRKVQRLTRTRPWEELAVLDQLAQRNRLFRHAADAYDQEILPYDGKVMLVRARTPLKAGGKVVDWDLGWSQLLMQRFPIFSVEGDHVGIMDEPGATELAQIIDQHLGT